LIRSEGLRPSFSQFTCIVILSIELGTSYSLLPHVLVFVHFHSSSPGSCRNIMLFGKFRVSFLMKLLGDCQVSLLEEVTSELRHKSDHIVILTTFFVHGNGKIIFLDDHVHLFSLSPFFLLLELLGLLDVEVGDLTFRKVLSGNSKSLLPFTRFCVHFKCINWKSSLQIVLLCEIILSDT
jgi:hypothetical protein